MYYVDHVSNNPYTYRTNQIPSQSIKIYESSFPFVKDVSKVAYSKADRYCNDGRKQPPIYICESGITYIPTQ